MVAISPSLLSSTVSLHCSSEIFSSLLVWLSHRWPLFACAWSLRCSKPQHACIHHQSETINFFCILILSSFSTFSNSREILYCFEIIVEWHFFLTFPPSKPWHIYPSPTCLQIHGLYKNLIVIVWIYAYTHTCKYNLFNWYKATCMYVFRADYLALETNWCVLPWRGPPLTFPFFFSCLWLLP